MRQLVRTVYLFRCVILAIAVSSTAAAQADQRLIKFVKQLDVKTLDSRLPSQPLDVWLHSGLHLDEVLWRLSPDCDSKPVDGGAPSQSTCIRFTFRRGYAGGWGLISTPKRRDRGTQESRLEIVTVMNVNRRLSEEEKPPARLSYKLSDLPHLLLEFSGENR